MQPHLAVTPPPYSEPPSSKSLTIGGRPKSLFGSSFRERPFSSVLPERPSSYAHFDNFDRRPSTPPNRTFPRLGVLPSPTFDAASSNIIDRRKADSDDTSVEPSSRDDSVSASQSSSTAPMELSNPYGLENASTGQSSSRSSSPAQSNPVVVGDVPVFLERSGESQVSTQYSGNEVKETDTTDNLETPKQADFPRSFGQTDAFTSSSPVGQHEQLREQASAPESNEASRQSLLQYGSSTPSVHDEVYKIPQILSAESSITAKQQPGMAARGSSPSFGDSTQAGNWLQSKLQPPPAHGQVDSPGDNDAERSVPTYAKSVADVAQESYNQSEASTSSAPALEHPLHLQAEPVAFGNNRSSERSISPLPLVSGPAGLSAAVETNPSHFTDSATNDSELSTTYDMPRSSINVMQSSAGLPSSGRRSESPEVSPERPSEKVINESAVMDQQQPRSSQMQQAPPLNQSRAPAQSQPRPFSFIQYSAGQSEVPAQDYMPAEQLTESGYENAQILADHGRPSSDRRLEQLISRDTTNQYNSLSTREDEKSRNVPTGHEEYTSVNQHHRSLLRSSQDPNIMELPVYHQHQPPLAQDLPSHYYPAETRRQEGFLPRQQGTEYQLTGVGPPRPEQVNNKSRRSSRGSSFLRRISGGSSSRPEIPTVASTGQRTNPDVTINSTETRKKMSKRASLFRAFDQNGGSESDRSKESMVAHAPGSRTDLLQRSGPITPKALEVATSGEHNPKIKGNKKMQDKLQRFSMSGTAEADTGKKKRFSFLRNFFTRSGSTGNSRKAPASALSARQAQMTQRSAPSQSAPPRSQNRSAYFDHASQLNPPPEPPAFQNQVLGEPPPLGGYYAPVGGRLPSTTFVGGRRLSEQQVGEAKHGFESQSGFRGPYHGSSASSRTPNLRYQDTPFPHNHPAGTPYASQYDIPSIPSIPAVYRRDYSEQEAGSGARAYGSAQTTADDTQQPPYNHWTEQPDPRRIDSFGSPGVQLPPQNPRPDLPSQYSMSSAQPISPVLTPQYTYPDIWEQAYQNTHTRPYRLEQVAQPTTWTSNMPANGTPAPRPHHNFSRHHQVYPTNQIREYTPQYRLPQANVPSSTDPATEGLPPPPPPKSPTSRPLGTRTTSIPQHVAVSPSPPNPPVPPKDDRPLLPPGHHESEILNPPSQPFHPNGDTYPHQTTKPYAQDPQRDFGSPSGHMPELPASRSPREEEEEEIVMSSTSYPGQEWSPSGLGHWDED
ncbi:MAG: hypothetical protein M1830_004577 [Pleopsidium flavum]|nr:MAG: hypothetical protein M1830_004577 [Pleopsidium flavum]